MNDPETAELRRAFIVTSCLSSGDRVEGVFDEEHIALNYADWLDEQEPGPTRRIDRFVMNSAEGAAVWPTGTIEAAWPPPRDRVWTVASLRRLLESWSDRTSEGEASEVWIETGPWSSSPMTNFALLGRGDILLLPATPDETLPTETP